MTPTLINSLVRLRAMLARADVVPGHDEQDPRDPRGTRRGSCLSWFTHARDVHSASAIDFFEFFFRPLHSIFGRHALDRLGIHIDDDVFG